MGDNDGHVVLQIGTEEQEIDRLGDAVVALGRLLEERLPGVGAMAAYAVCLSTRGVSEPIFVRQVLARAFPFVSGADPASRTIYDVVTRLEALVADSFVEGNELRERLLDEANRIHREEDT